MSFPSDEIELIMKPFVFSQFRATAELEEFETLEADTNIGMLRRKEFFHREKDQAKGKYWNR